MGVTFRNARSCPEKTQINFSIYERISAIVKTDKRRTMK
jgi:hypothetical protein